MRIYIDQDTLSATIEALQELQERYELEAAALAQLAQDCPEAHSLAVERAAAAGIARGLFIFFAKL